MLRARDTRPWGGLVILSIFVAGMAGGDERLVPGVATEAEVGPGEVRVFLVDADEGSALHLRADHLRLHLAVAVKGPDGEKLGEAAELNAPDPLTLTVIVSRS